MMMRMTWRTSILGACVALVGTAVGTAAQTAPTDDSMGEAAELVRQADAVVEAKSDWGRAALLYQEAAELSDGDPVAATRHRQAGILAFYAGREGRAVEQLTHAAETALEWGDVATAARSYLEAAWVAHQEGDGERTLSLAERAERLARSPLLARAERADLMRRIAEPQAPEFEPDA